MISEVDEQHPWVEHERLIQKSDVECAEAFLEALPLGEPGRALSHLE